MKTTLGLIFVAIACSLAKGSENCDRLGVRFYEEQGCKPEIEAGKECPSSFDCKDYQNDPNTCQLKGKVFKKGDSIDKELTDPSCSVACRCDGGNKITCAILDCPEWLGVPIPPKCYRTYELDHCCSKGKNCEPYDKLATCEVDGRKYKEGEKFSPGGQCLSCVCKAGFSGKLEAPFCERTNCGIEVREADKIQKNCAPVYLREGENGTLCCPAAFVCPSATDVINEKPETAKKCKYGEKLLNLGESFENKLDYYGTLKTVNCKCDLPPLVTCIGKF